MLSTKEKILYWLLCLLASGAILAVGLEHKKYRPVFRNDNVTILCVENTTGSCDNIKVKDKTKVAENETGQEN